MKNNITAPDYPKKQVASQLQVMDCNVFRAMYAQMETSSYGIQISVLEALKKIFKAEYGEFFEDLP